MTAPRFARATIAALVATAFLGLAAGCLGASSPPAGPSDGAIENRSRADQAATDWDPEAELVSIAGGEGKLAPLVRDGSLAFLPGFVNGTEAALADGRSPAWAYEYRAGDRGLGVLVASDGSLVNSTEFPAGAGQPLPEAAIDSTEAARSARLNGTSLADVDEPAAAASRAT